MGKRIYVRSGGVWVDVTTSSGGSTYYYQSSAPGTAAPGDIWVDSDNDLIDAIPLTDSVSSTSTTTAATPNSVKTAYDLANTANTTAGTAIPKNTVTTAGDLVYASGSATVTRLGIGTAAQLLSVGTAGIPEWTTPTAIGTANTSGAYGVTTLTDSTASTSTTTAATPASVKSAFDEAAAKVATVAGTSPISTSGSTAITVSIADATTSVKGAVQLTDSTSSTSTTTAATPNSVKTAYDLAGAAIPKNTATIAGDLIYASGSATLTRLAVGTAGQVLTVGTAGIPEWGTAASGGGNASVESILMLMGA